MGDQMALQLPGVSLLKRHRDDLIVLFLMVVGFVLNIYAPVWFAPPYVEYTVWLYLVLFFAWIPVYVLLMHRRRRLVPILLVAILGAFVTGCGCMVFRPDSTFAVTVLDKIRCEPQPTDDSRVRYACTRHAFEGSQYDQTLTLEGPKGSPILFRVAVSKPS
jgi:hypothetical protein